MPGCCRDKNKLVTEAGLQPSDSSSEKSRRQAARFCFLAPLCNSGRYRALQPVHIGGGEGLSTHAPVSLLDFFDEHER
jgi:hypothetical protein